MDIIKILGFSFHWFPFIINLTCMLKILWQYMKSFNFLWKPRCSKTSLTCTANETIAESSSHVFKGLKTLYHKLLNSVLFWEKCKKESTVFLFRNTARSKTWVTTYNILFSANSMTIFKCSCCKWCQVHLLFLSCTFILYTMCKCLDNIKLYINNVLPTTMDAFIRKYCPRPQCDVILYSVTWFS